MTRRGIVSVFKDQASDRRTEDGKGAEGENLYNIIISLEEQRRW